MPFIGTVEFRNAWATLSVPTSILFSYPNFASTAGLSFVSSNFTPFVSTNAYYLTNTGASQTTNLYRSPTAKFNRNFSFQWNFECSGGSGTPADGFCIQWTNAADGVGALTGGGVGRIANVTTIIAFTFLTYTNNALILYKANVQSTQYTGTAFRGNNFYWLDYDNAAQTIKIYQSATAVKPASTTFNFSSVAFDSGSYFFCVSAATGGASDNHILRSMTLTFT